MNERDQRRRVHGKREIQRKARKRRHRLNVLITALAICLVGALMLVLRGGMFSNLGKIVESVPANAVTEVGETATETTPEETTPEETASEETAADSTPSSDQSNSELAGGVTTQTVSTQDGENTEIETDEDKITYILAHSELYPAELQDVVLKSPQTVDYVYEYPEKKDESFTIDLTAEAQSDTVPLLIQWDERWGYYPYGSGMIGYTGCGPTCLSMVALYLTNDASYTPIAMADYAEENGYSIPGSGTSWEMMSTGCKAFGLTSEELPMVEKQMTDALDEGKLIILNLGPGDFTTTGHFVVVTGYTDEGFTINDPNSLERSAQTWTFDRLEDQVRNLWAIGKA